MTKRAFVDLQVNGLMGIDFSKPGLTLDAVRRVTKDLIAKGTVAYCPTVITSAMETYRENLAVLAKAMDEPDLRGHILGLHLEGPFISAELGARGAHQQEFIREPSIDDFDRLQEWADGKAIILTVAPEQPGSSDLIRHARSRDVVVSLGHHHATDDALASAVAAGARCSTHLGNGIPNVLHRHQNPIWWQLACDKLWGTFITDGHHLPPAFIKVALRAKTIDRFIVVSDASPLAGLPVGSYECFGKTLEIEPSGRIWCEESQGLGGSHSTMLECMNYLASLKLLDEEELWRVSLVNPLRLLGKSPEDLNGVAWPEVNYDGERFTVS